MYVPYHGARTACKYDLSVWVGWLVLCIYCLLEIGMGSDLYPSVASTYKNMFDDNDFSGLLNFVSRSYSTNWLIKHKRHIYT